MALLADFGTTWTKLIDTDSGARRIEKSRHVADLTADLATGNNARLRSKASINELIALFEGGLRSVKEDDFILVDIGSRDLKYIKVADRKVKEMDWSTSCGTLTGFTLELLASYFSIDYGTLAPSTRRDPFTCGLLGIERLFERLANGSSVEDAVSAFTHAIALNAFNFIGKPDKFFLSGGMCENPLFIASFSGRAEVIPLGRFVLLEGVLKEYEERHGQAGRSE
jgi:activator of 2-hydroxyglutaryl-CoA dehydratase